MTIKLIKNTREGFLLLKDEGGFVLVLSLVVLFTLSLLGLTSLMTAQMEMKISANENNANLSLYAADAGLNHALTKVNVDSGIISYGSPNTWQYPTDSDPSIQESIYLSLGNGGDYEWYAHFKQDVEDLDGDSDTDERVYFNQHFGYPSSLFVNDGEGYPVIEVISEGHKGTSEKLLALELGRNQFNVWVKGGITARSSVDLTGNVSIDGNNHDINGNLGGSCGTDMPGAYVDTGNDVTISGSGSLDGNPPKEINDGTEVMPTTPWGYLGIDQSDFESNFTQISADDSAYDLSDLSGNVWINEVYADVRISSNLTVEGILVVHNRFFDPDVWEVSNSGNPATYDPTHGDYDTKADPSHADWDPDYGPAEFTMSGTGTWKGVIIADTVIKFSGNPTVIGAVISLSSLGVQHTGVGNASIVYSCEAVTQATTQGYATKLVWRRL